MRFSSYYWPHKNERGWIFGPWFGRLYYVSFTVRKLNRD